MLWGDLDAIREEMMEEARAKQQFTLRLNTSHLANSDSVSFSNGANEITAQRNGTVSIAYTLGDSLYNNKCFSIYVNGNRKYQTIEPGTRTFNYTVNPADATNNVITIYTYSMHSNLILLDPPANVALNKSGAITFTAGANNAEAGATHSFTLYRNNTQVTGFINRTITNNETPTNIVNAMLAASGKHVVLDLSDCQMPADGIFNPDSTVGTGKNFIIEIILPDGALTIPAGDLNTNAFRNFSQLRSVSGENVNSIGSTAFRGTSIESVDFPAATTIGDGAFALTRNTALTITLGSNAPMLGTTIFGSSPNSRTVTVQIPNGATGYSPFNGTQVTVSGANTDVNWGNGFRGGGWNGSTFTNASSVNTGVTVNIERIP